MFLVLCFGVLAVEFAVMSIQVKKGQIRSTPSFFGKIVSEAYYGDTVNVTEETQDWKKVSVSRGAQGWMHISALTNKRIILGSGESDAELAATSDEVMLAGKGFNKDIEEEYKRRNPGANYTLIDKMEMREVSWDEMYAFLKAGDLTILGGEPQ